MIDLIQRNLMRGHLHLHLSAHNQKNELYSETLFEYKNFAIWASPFSLYIMRLQPEFLILIKLSYLFCVYEHIGCTKTYYPYIYIY